MGTPDGRWWRLERWLPSFCLARVRVSRLDWWVSPFHLEAFAEREWRRWNRNLGWGWFPRLLVLMFAAVAFGGAVVLGWTRQEPGLSDLLLVALFFAFVAHGWSVGGVVRIVAAEMEAGTMELLLLTRIRPMDLILGQYWFGLLGSLVTAMGLIPWLWVGGLNAGWGWDAWVWAAAVWLAAGVSLNSLYLALASWGRTLSTGGMAGLGVAYLLVSTFWVVPILVASPTSAGVKEGALLALTGYGVVSFLGLATAGWNLSRAVTSAGRVRSARRQAWMGTPRRPGQAKRRKLLEGNPIEWLASAGCPWWAWIVVAVGAVVPLWNGAATAADMFAAMSWVRGIVLILLAFQAYGQLRYDLREGTWEALLRTPITVPSYVMGHLTAWWRQQGPLLVVIAIIPVGFALWDHWDRVSGRELAQLLVSGILLTGADAILASIWFLGSAVKFDGGSFLLGAVLSAGILTLMQSVHALGGLGLMWPWIWAGLALLIFLASRETVCREIGEQLDQAAGLEVSPVSWPWPKPGWPTQRSRGTSGRRLRILS